MSTSEVEFVWATLNDLATVAVQIFGGAKAVLDICRRRANRVKTTDGKLWNLEEFRIAAYNWCLTTNAILRLLKGETTSQEEALQSGESELIRLRREVVKEICSRPNN